MSVRKIFYFIILLGFIVSAAMVLIYKKIDLENYRHHLEQQLSTSLGQPVSIGRGKLTFRNGPALDLRELRIGKEEAPLVEVPHLTASLEIAPLFDGQIILKQVLIDNPSLQIWLPFKNRPARGTTHKIFDALGIHILTIRNANLRIHQSQPSGQAEKVLQFNNFNVVLKGWQAEVMGKLVINGQLQQPGAPANFIFDISLPSSPDPASWRLEEFTYQLAVQNLSTALFPKPPGSRIPAAINGYANLKGIPAQGAVLSVELSSSDGREKFFELAGQWISTAGQETLDNLSGSLLGLPVKGKMQLQRQAGKNILTGNLGAGHVELNRKILKLWQVLGAEQLQSGKLDRLALKLKNEWPAENLFPGMPRLGLQFALSQLRWDKPELKQVKDVSLDLSLTNRTLNVNDGRVEIGGKPILISGKIEQLPADPRLDLKVRYEADLAKLEPQLQLPAGWSMSGSVGSQLHFSGPLRQPGFLLDADLAKTQLAFGNLLKKTPSQTGSLRMTGLLDKQHLQLDQLRLRLGDLQLTGNGSFPWQPQGNGFLLNIDPFELSPLQQLSPLLSKLKLQGELSLALETKNQAVQGALRLNKVGSHLFNIVGDLNHVSGKLRFDKQGMEFNYLSARLGDSSLTLTGSLANWSDPQLKLDLKGDKVRARDLIFLNPELMLYDLEGHLRINRNGIYFEPVKVRLEQGTTASVSGKVENFQDPQTILDIEAKQADILQVIGLFQGAHRNTPKNRNSKHKPTLISVKVQQGTLDGLRFNNAEGLIKDHNGVFTLFPLKFQIGKGHCLARVEFDRNDPEGLLKISGHAENIDAAILHQDIFKARGLIKGPLRGDFYVEGSPRDGNFWKSALGGMHLQVKNGTLLKFHGLASVFSILNVSQLFTFKLPDIDKEGMPFSLLEGSVRFDHGWMKTEDMHVVSEAMNLSLVGKQSLVKDQVDYLLGVMPLRTVDKVVTSIPIAGWVLAGKDKAVFTVHFKIKGPSSSPTVTAVPVDSISDTVFGIVKRTFGLPGKLVKDIGTLFKSEPKKKK